MPATISVINITSYHRTARSHVITGIRVCLGRVPTGWHRSTDKATVRLLADRVRARDVSVLVRSRKGHALFYNDDIPLRGDLQRHRLQVLAGTWPGGTEAIRWPEQRPVSRALQTSPVAGKENTRHPAVRQ